MCFFNINDKSWISHEIYQYYGWLFYSFCVIQFYGKCTCCSRAGLFIDFHAVGCIWIENSGRIWTLFREESDTWGGFGQCPYLSQSMKSIIPINKVIKWLR